MQPTPTPKTFHPARFSSPPCPPTRPPAADSACSFTRSTDRANKQLPMDLSQARCRCRSSFPAYKISGASTTRMRRARRASIESAVACGFQRRRLFPPSAASPAAHLCR
ncbi:unnamed protein product [Urochloa humidicola]